MAVGDKRNTPEAPEKPDKLENKRKKEAKQGAGARVREGLRQPVQP